MTGRHRDDAFDGPPPADPLMKIIAVPVGAALVVEVVGELDLQLPVAAAIRKAIGKNDGDDVEVQLTGRLN